MKLANSFVPNAPFLYPVKTRKVFRCFQGVEKGGTGSKWFYSTKKYLENNSDILMKIWTNAYCEKIIVDIVL